MAHPVAPLLHDRIAAAAALEGIDIVRGGTYVCMEGPQFSTYAESMTYKGLGYSVIGMTNLPEAKLAREAELCYATIAMVTDFDCWHPDHDAVDRAGHHLRARRQREARQRRWWRGWHVTSRASTSRVRSAPTGRSTPPSSPPPRRATSRLLKKLDAVAGRVLNPGRSRH